MIAWLRRHIQADPSGLLSSRLYNEQTFYRAFERDLHLCKNEAVIESPFITGGKTASLLPIFGKMRSRGVKITVITRSPAEHDAPYDRQAQDAIGQLLEIGVQVIYMGRHHRKLAIFDGNVLWEGSLNMLSQNDSCEFMRRIVSEDLARQMSCFVGHDRLL